MILQVHDELLLEVAEADLRGGLRRPCGRRWRGSCALAVPLRVDLGVGRSWAEAH